MIFVYAAILHTVMRTLATGGWSHELRNRGQDSKGLRLMESIVEKATL